MSKTIDSRVVEMRFDNKQFEAGAKTTMSTLGKLKEALKFSDSGKALEGIDNAVKGIKLDGIASGIEALEKRFSTLGIVGMRIIENITDGLMNKLNTAVNFVTNSIVSGGIKRAMNIENAHFQLQALLKDEVKVQAVMDNAMESVDGTAYAYDEAAKAASQFAASGIQAGEDMLNALKGITGVAAMTNSDFEGIARIFNTVAGNGRLMGDQLLQLSSRGMNAAATIADYFREVRGEAGMTEAAVREMVSDGEISFEIFSNAMTWAFGDSAKRANETFTGAMSNMKSALARIGADFVSPLIEQNGELVKLFNALRIKINDVRTTLKFDEQRSAISGLAEVTGMTNDELTEMFNTIKTNGKVSIIDLDRLSQKSAGATKALTKYINGVVDGSIRASYAITTALTDLTGGTEVSAADVRKFVQEGKIDLATFTAAMEKEFGNEKTVVKQFTDWFLDHISKIVDFINTADVTKPMEIFYYWFESAKNVVKGLLSVLKPIAKAFSDVFLTFDVEKIINFSEAVERFTAKLKLSERGSQNLHDAFKGVFSVAKLLVDIFFKLLGAIIPINEPIGEMGDGILGIVGAIGRALTSFVEMIRSSELLRKAFTLLSNGISLAINGLSKLIKMGKDFISKLLGMEGTTKLINSVASAFEKFGMIVTPYIQDFLYEAEKMIKSIFDLGNIDINGILEVISGAFADLAWEIEHFSFTSLLEKISEGFSNFASSIKNFKLKSLFESINEGFDWIGQKLKAFGDFLMTNESFAIFVKNAKKYGEDLKEAFSFENIMERLEKVMEVFGKFFNWVKETLAPAFKDFNLASVVAGGAGIAIIRALFKALKLFDKVTGPMVSFKELLGAVKGTLVAYQKDLKADAILKIAGAIGIFAAAITLLSFADLKKARESSVLLAFVGAALITATGYFIDVIKKTKTVNDAAHMLAKAGNNLTKALKWKAIGSTVKDFAESIILVGVAIIGLGIMWSRDSDSFMAALDAVKWIAVGIAAFIGITVLASKLGNWKGMASIGASILLISTSLMLIISSISKLLKMELPENYEEKLEIFKNILTELGVLALIMGASALISGGNQLPKMASAIKSLALLLLATVLSMKTLFGMEIPDDYELKLGILAGVFVAFGLLVVAMGGAAKLSGGNSFKAASTILSMIVFLAAIIAALFVLTIMPADKLINGAAALGVILVSLGFALAGAGQIAEKGTHKSVLAMALTVGAITAALAVLSMIPWDKLVVSAGSLGVILLILAANFKSLEKVEDAKKTLPAILAMIAVVAEISFALYVLSEQPWEELLAAAAAMGVTLLAFSKSFDMILSRDWSNDDVKKVGTFLLLTLAVIPIGAALYILAEQPWEGLLAAAAALSVVSVSLSLAFKIMSGVSVKASTIIAFVAGAVALIPMGFALNTLAGNDWNAILPAMTALGVVTIALAAALTLMSLTGPKILAGGAAFIAGAIALIPMAIALDTLAGNNWGSILPAMTALGVATVALAAALTLMSLTGPAILLGTIAFVAGAIALIPIAAVITTLSGLSWEEVAVGLITLAGALVIIGVAGVAGTAIAPGLLALSGALLVFGAAIAVVGLGLVVFMAALVSSLELLGELLNTLGDMPSFAEVGKNLIGGFIQGIIDGFSSVIETVKEVAGGVLDSIKSVLGIHSPSTEAAKLGVYTDEGFAQGVEQGSGAIDNSIGSVFGGIADKIDISSLFGTGENASGNFISGLITNKGDVSSSFDGLLQNANSNADTSQFFGTGENASGELMNGMTSGFDFSKMQSMFTGGFGDSFDMSQFFSTGEGASGEMMNGMTSGFDTSEMQSMFTEGLGENFDTSQFFSTGENASEEFLNGFTSNSETSANGAAVELANYLNAAIDEQDFSPSAISIVEELISSIRETIEANNESLQTSASELGSNLCEGIRIGIEKKQSIVMTTQTELTTAMMSNLKKDLAISNFNPIGQNVVQGLVNGINTKKPLSLSTVGNLCTAIVNKFKTDLVNSTFKTFGENIVIWLSQGIEGKNGTIQSTVSKMCSTIVESFKNHLSASAFNAIGANAALGLKNGIESKTNAIAQAAIRAAQQAVASAKAALNEHSPSKVMEKVGEFFSMGFAEGIVERISAVSLAGERAADGAVEPVKEAVDALTDIINSEDFNVDPVIRPVVDLSDVQNGAREISSLMNRSYNLSSINDLALGASASFNANKQSKVNGEYAMEKGETGVKYVFNQYNTSPKALSRSEIYRQTNNQFSAFRRAVNPS